MLDRAKQPHILLVDDDDLNRRMMGLLLSDQGYTYETASNGAEAVEAIQSERYDLILMDLQMPVLDGFEATREIRAWEEGNQHIPIIALTAMLFQDEIQLCMDAGMDDCVAKPFDTKQLIRLVESYVNPSAHGREDKPGEEMTLEDGNPLLDIDDALPRFSGDVQNYREFLKEFIDSLPEKVEVFRAAFQSNDLDALSKQAHNLKGVSASLGAKQISSLALQLDQHSQHQDMELIRELLTELESNVSIFRDKALRVLSLYTQNDVDADRIL